MAPGIHVYIVEDDATMVGLLRTLLEMEHWQVSTYDHKPGASIPALVKSARPSLILMDVNLRDLDGLDVLQQLRADPEIDRIKIVMTSGSDYKDICLRYGADDFLLKPYMPDDLISMIKEVIAKDTQK